MLPRPPRTDPIETDRDRPFDLHLFVCTSGPECPLDGPAEEIRTALKKRAKELGLKDRVRVNQSGCLDQCGHGPNMVVYPDGVWYSHLSVDDALTIFDAHAQGRGPVDRLRFTLGPGGCKARRDEDGKSLCHGECHGRT